MIAGAVELLAKIEEVAEIARDSLNFRALQSAQQIINQSLRRLFVSGFSFSGHDLHAVEQSLISRRKRDLGS